MVETVVEIFTQVASGAATAVGAGVGQAVSDIVRERFGAEERGRSVVQAVDERPGDPDAVASLRELLRTELASDPEFGQRIGAALAGPQPAEPPRQTTGNIVIHGSTVKGRSTIALGPVTINDTRSARLSLLAVALILASLAALGIYGATRWAADGDSLEENAVTVLSPDRLREILPSTGSVPANWTRNEEPNTNPDARGTGLISSENIGYLMGGPDVDSGITFSVTGFTNADNASKFFHKVDAGSNGKEREDLTVPLPTIGDERKAFAWRASTNGPGGVYTVLRVGTVLMTITGTDADDQAFATSRLEKFARMMAERAQQAQNGRKPTGYVREA
ncbi:hypothetical protein [Streptomyces sp. AB3(2024)]|uniref:hypothetical protein n=1 Tax=Streptomyces sp. AB3(2024) TaxID=3317321 RepID=UPI0035A2E1B3